MDILSYCMSRFMLAGIIIVFFFSSFVLYRMEKFEGSTISIKPHGYEMKSS